MMTTRVSMALLLLSAACLAAPPAGAAELTTVRVFHMQGSHVSVREAANAIQPLLSESGSLTVQPHQSRIIVQDQPEVVARVAEVLERLRETPERFSVRLELLEASNEPLNSAQRTEVDARIRRVFSQFSSYQRIGLAMVEGDLGDASIADLGAGFRVHFVPMRLPSPEESPWGIPPAGGRIHLDRLTLTLNPTSSSGSQKPTEVLRTSVVLGPTQRAIFGASASEESDHGLVLIIEGGAEEGG